MPQLGGGRRDLTHLRRAVVTRSPGSNVGQDEEISAEVVGGWSREERSG